MTNYTPVHATLLNFTPPSPPSGPLASTKFLKIRVSSSASRTLMNYLTCVIFPPSSASKI